MDLSYTLGSETDGYGGAYNPGSLLKHNTWGIAKEYKNCFGSLIGVDYDSMDDAV